MVSAEKQEVLCVCTVLWVCQQRAVTVTMLTFHTLMAWQRCRSQLLLTVHRQPLPCLRPCSKHNCGWAADLARGREWTQKFWRKFESILNCLITRPKCTILIQKIKKIWPLLLTKNSGSDPGAARKISQRGRKVTKRGTDDNSKIGDYSAREWTQIRRGQWGGVSQSSVMGWNSLWWLVGGFHHHVTDLLVSAPVFHLTLPVTQQPATVEHALWTDS